MISDARETQLRRVAPVRAFMYTPEDPPEGYQPVRIEVYRARNGLIVDVADTIIDAVIEYSTGQKTLGQILQAGGRNLMAGLLKPLVHIPECPELTVEDLPPDAIPECLSCVLKDFSPGKWQGLATEIEGRFGIKLKDRFAEAKSAVTTTEQAD